MGNVRSENQDRAIIAKFTGGFALDGFLLFALCDGIGGLRDGGICASRGLAMFLAAMVRDRGNPLDRRLVNCANLANSDIFQDYQENGGATLSAVAATSRGEILGINLGDSRIYRRLGTTLSALTLDDNIGSQLQLLGKGDAAGSALGRQLTQYLGIGRELEPKILPITPSAGPLFLTTDGIHGLGERILSEIAVSAPNLADVVRRMTTVAKWCKGSDNGTIVAIAPDLASSARQPAGDSMEILEIWDSFGNFSVAGDRFLFRRAPYEAGPRLGQLKFHGGGEPQPIPGKDWPGSSKDEQRKGAAKKRAKKQPAKSTVQPPPDVQITEEPAS
jgi:serine/threonine protein phosphatase PrpC